jgi:ribosomal protein L23
MPLNRLLIKKPLISEKATDLGSAGKYVFLVDPRANKNQVKLLIEEIYGVKVEKTNIVRIKHKGNTYKKAIVTLKKGNAIDILPH